MDLWPTTDLAVAPPPIFRERSASTIALNQRVANLPFHCLSTLQFKTPSLLVTSNSQVIINNWRTSSPTIVHFPSSALFCHHRCLAGRADHDVQPKVNSWRGEMVRGSSKRASLFSFNGCALHFFSGGKFFTQNKAHNSDTQNVAPEEDKDEELEVTKEILASEEALWDLYERWCMRYRQSRSEAEKRSRFNNFKETAWRVYNTNKSSIKLDASYRVGLNCHADITKEEFAQLYCGCIYEDPPLEMAYETEGLDITKEVLASEGALWELFERVLRRCDMSLTEYEKRSTFENFKENTRAMYYDDKAPKTYRLCFTREELERLWKHRADFKLRNSHHRTGAASKNAKLADYSIEVQVEVNSQTVC